MEPRSNVTSVEADEVVVVNAEADVDVDGELEDATFSVAGVNFRTMATWCPRVVAKRLVIFS